MIKQIKFYGVDIYYLEKGELVYWRLKDDFLKRINLREDFQPFLEYEYQEIKNLNLEDLSKIKKLKIYNKNNQYIGIDKSNGRIIYYDKSRYRILKKENLTKIPVAFYLPYLDIDSLERVSDCINDSGLNFWITKIIYKNCNTKYTEIDENTLEFIIKEYRNYLKSNKNVEKDG